MSLGLDGQEQCLCESRFCLSGSWRLSRWRISGLHWRRDHGTEMWWSRRTLRISSFGSPINLASLLLARRVLVQFPSCVFPRENAVCRICRLMEQDDPSSRLSDSNPSRPLLSTRHGRTPMRNHRRADLNLQFPVRSEMWCSTEPSRIPWMCSNRAKRASSRSVQFSSQRVRLRSGRQWKKCD